MKVKSPKVVDLKQKQTRKLDPVDQKSAKNYNLFVTSRSLQNEGQKACMKTAVESAIKCAKGSRLASIGTLQLQFSNESDAKAAVAATNKLSSDSVAIKVTTSLESYVPNKRCLYVGRDANLDIIVNDVKTAFTPLVVVPAKRFHKFTGLLILTFGSVKLAEEADEVSFKYGGEVRRCRPCLRYRRPSKAVDASDKPAAKKQKLNNDASVETPKRKKTNKQKVEESEEEDEEEPQNGANHEEEHDDDDDDDNDDDDNDDDDDEEDDE